jgi:hypothetical protein
MSTETKSNTTLALLILGAVAFVAVILGFAIAKKLGYVEALEAKRAGAIAIGCVLIIAGNIVPKLRLFSGQGFDAGRVVGAERVAGWMLVLAGLAFVGLWVFAPSDDLMIYSSLVGLCAFGLVGLIWMGLALRPRAPAEAAAESNDSARVKRLALSQILFALFWVFAIFLADSLWGDVVSRWMAVGYVVIAGVLATPGAMLARRGGNSSAEE